MSDSVELVWDVECEVTESPVWDARHRRVLFADMLGGRILGYNVDDGSHQEWSLHDTVGSFGLCRSGRLIVALRRRMVFLDLEDGSIEPLTEELDEPTNNRLNDGRPGPDGCYWVGTIDGRLLAPGVDPFSLTDPTASLYRVLPDGTMERRAAGYLCFNSLAFSPDGKAMYASKEVPADTRKRFIEQWDFDLSTGASGDSRSLFVVGDAEGRPDGAAVAADGSFWAAGVSAGYVSQFSLSGEVLAKYRMPFPAPSMPCFADSSLYITSIRKPGGPHEGFPLNLAGLFRLPVPTTGAPVGVFADT